jgi:protein TonB
MNREMKSFLFSSALHLCIVAAAVSFAGVPAPDKTPVLIDFTVQSGPGTKKDSGRNNPGGAPPSRHVAAVRRPNIAKPQPAPAEPDTPRPAEVVTSTLQASAEAAPVAPSPAPQVAATAVASGAASGTQGSGGVGGGSGTGRGSGSDGSGGGGDQKGESAETLRMRYLKEHFAYIRDLVAGNLRYPVLARRMGWRGRLAVEFVIQRDGTANNVRIVRSSGVPLLDNDARNTVIKSAPFPKPPVSARLVIPVEYILED